MHDTLSLRPPPSIFGLLCRKFRKSLSLKSSVQYHSINETDPHEAQELTKWHIHHIRQVLEPDARNPIYVINVRGTGYRLVTG